jgi:hypothetical protein
MSGRPAASARRPHTTELEPLLHEPGIELSGSQVHRLVTGIPERLSLPVIVALGDALEVTPAASLVTDAANNAPRPPAATSDYPGRPFTSTQTPLHARLHELLDDDTGDIRPELQPLAHSLPAMPELDLHDDVRRIASRHER